MFRFVFIYLCNYLLEIIVRALSTTFLCVMVVYRIWNVDSEGPGQVLGSITSPVKVYETLKDWLTSFNHNFPVWRQDAHQHCLVLWVPWLPAYTHHTNSGPVCCLNVPCPSFYGYPLLSTSLWPIVWQEDIFLTPSVLHIPPEKAATLAALYLPLCN